ncbi:hypothetical protein EST38_g10133 [Candolleomyces aberdarensis]|uniref:Uncharacterized protein n=1 Tax=Candolleomyces aberdarensis TaxID=2316362 RepID=A0A4Q2DAD2_9AGAR|nr:hypothetical protein EST38_g10133 [Candolleomyces aberdarensis]
MQNALQLLKYHLWTLVLFTWSDIKTTLIPVSVLGLGTAQVCSPSPILNGVKAVFWIWSILLQFNINNQAISPEEDAKNKPWRPIPSGRISLRNAMILRWISVVYCCLLSFYLRKAVLIPSTLFTCFVFVYNSLGWDRNGFMKIFMLAYGYPTMALGAVLVAECPGPAPLAEILDWKKFPELIVFALVIATTVHTQDFQDVEGDREIGRNTVPMMFPVSSRFLLLFLLPLWTTFIAAFSSPPIWLGAVYYGLSLVVAVRCVLYRSPKDDAWTNFFYSWWLSCTLLHLCFYKRQANALFSQMDGSTTQMFLPSRLGPLLSA